MDEHEIDWHELKKITSSLCDERDPLNVNICLIFFSSLLIKEPVPQFSHFLLLPHLPAAALCVFVYKKLI